MRELHGCQRANVQHLKSIVSCTSCSLRPNTELAMRRRKVQREASGSASDAPNSSFLSFMKYTALVLLVVQNASVLTHCTAPQHTQLHSFRVPHSLQCTVRTR